MVEPEAANEEDNVGDDPEEADGCQFEVWEEGVVEHAKEWLVAWWLDEEAGEEGRRAFIDWFIDWHI